MLEVTFTFAAYFMAGIIGLVFITDAIAKRDAKAREVQQVKPLRETSPLIPSYRS